MDRLTHIDESGNAVMVDVAGKDETKRIAVAKGRIRMNNPAYRAVESKTAQKGDVLAVARIAGIMAAKRTAEMIPLCHPLALTKCTVDFTLYPESREIEAVCTAALTGRTGVEMEALHGVSTALLTIYDMCKALDRAMVLSDIRLMHKAGGKSGVFDREDGCDAGRE